MVTWTLVDRSGEVFNRRYIRQLNGEWIWQRQTLGGKKATTALVSMVSCWLSWVCFDTKSGHLWRGFYLPLVSRCTAYHRIVFTQCKGFHLMSFVYPKTSPAPAPESIQKFGVLNCVFLHISPRTWSLLDLWFLCWFFLWVVAVGRWYGTLVWLALFRLFHVEHVIMFVPWQHEIHGICNGKHKADADFGPTGIKSFVIKQKLVPVPSLPTKQGWEDYYVVLFHHVPAY